MITSRTKWTRTLQKGLVDVLIDHSDARWRGEHNGWTTEGWNKITKEFNKKFPDARLTKIQLKRQERYLKTNYQLVKELRNRSDTFWSSDCFIFMPMPVWKELIQAKKRVKQWQSKPFPLFDLLASLYEEQMLSEQDSNSVTNKKEVKKSSRDSMSDAMESCAESKRASDTMESCIESKRVNSTCEQLPSRSEDDFSISRCIKILNDLEFFDEDEKAEASKNFLDAGNRQKFISLLPHRRTPWISRRLAGLPDIIYPN